MSYGAMHPWEGHDPGKYGMFTVVLYCFVVDSFCFFVVANKPMSPGLAASLCSLPDSVQIHFQPLQSKHKQEKQQKTQLSNTKKTNLKKYKWLEYINTKLLIYFDDITSTTKKSSIRIN